MVLWLPLLAKTPLTGCVNQQLLLAQRFCGARNSNTAKWRPFPCSIITEDSAGKKPGLADDDLITWGLDIWGWRVSLHVGFPTHLSDAWAEHLHVAFPGGVGFHLARRLCSKKMDIESNQCRSTYFETFRWELHALLWSSLSHTASFLPVLLATSKS